MKISRRWLLVFAGIVAALPLSTAFGEQVLFDLKVHGGKQDAKNVPVTVPLTLPAALMNATALQISTVGGEPIAGQVTPQGICINDHAADSSRSELHFILPAIKAGEIVSLHGGIKSGSASADPASSFHWRDVPKRHSLLSFGDRPVLDYMCEPLDESSKARREETFKPYHHLYDPEGKILVTKGPGGLYPHHRALFFGFNKVSYGSGKTADVWHCTKGCYQSHEKLLSEEAGPVLGRQLVAIDWRGQDGQPFAHEKREMTVYSLPGGTMVDFASHLETAGERVKLDGDPQHSGFHFRAAQEVADKTNLETIFIRADGPAKPGDTINWDAKNKSNDPRTINQPWKGMSFVIGGQRYTAAILELSGNPKEARFSERNYGRFGSYFEYELTKDHPLDIRYRVWLQKGQMTPEDIASLAAEFVEPLTVELKLEQ